MTYIIMSRVTDKVIKQFSDYYTAFAYAKELKNKYMIVMISLNTETYKVEEAMIF